jgi:penicillin-binding protein 1A
MAKRKKPSSQGKQNLLISLFVILSMVTAGFAGLLFRYKDLPSGDTISKFEPARTTQAGYSGTNNGKLVNLLTDDTCYMQNVPKAELTELIRKIAYNSEDRDFNYHAGVNPTSIIRAIIANLKAGEVVEGASTIDIQTAQEILKQTYPGYSRLGSFDKKMIEMLFSIKLNVNYMTKDQILYTYLQLVPIYGNLCGVSSVAEQMLGKKVKDLTVNELVTMISALPGPDIYNPIRHPEDARNQRNITVEKIIENGKKNQSLTPEEITELEKVYLRGVNNMPLPKFVEPNFFEVGTNSWVSQTIKTELRDAKLPSTIYGKGYQIETTFDPKMQKALDKTIARWVDEGRFNPNWEIGMVVMDAENFGIKAVIGGQEQFSPTNQFNMAIDSEFLTGSVFKEADYAVYLEEIFKREKYIPSTVLAQRGGLRYLQGATGKTSIRTAFKDSVNTAAVGAVIETSTDNKFGGEFIVDKFRQFGVQLPKDLEVDETIALGVLDLKLFEMNMIPASLMNGGTFPKRMGLYGTPVTSIAKIRDKDGKVLFDYTQSPREQAFAPEVAEAMQSHMRAVVTDGTGKAANIAGLNSSGKTGTTDNAVTVLFQYNFTIDGVTYSSLMRIKHKDNTSLGGLYGGTFVAPLVREAVLSMQSEMEKE